jgi:CheY-like chemotaxis protein
MNGWQLIDALRQRRPAIRIVMISGYYFEDDIRVARALQAAEIDGFLAKPFQIEAVVAIAAGLGGDGRRRPQRSGAAARLCPVAPVRDCSTDAPTN